MEMVQLARYERVTKSLVNGKFIPVTKLTAAQRVAHKGGLKGAYKGGMNKEMAAFKAEHHDPAMKKTYRLMGSNNPNKTKRLANKGNFFFGAAIREGGPSAGRSKVAVNRKAIRMETEGDPERGRDMFAHTKAHEQAHADVKRSAFRVHHQIPGSDYKKGREEARADYLAAGHHSGWKKYKNNAELSPYPESARWEKNFHAENDSAPKKPKSTFHEGYFGLMDQMKAKGVKPKSKK
jgi:hypothetical protein